MSLTKKCVKPGAMIGRCLSVASGSFPYIKSGKYHKQAALGFMIAGIPGVLIAAFIVKSLPLSALQWLVIIVCLYTGISMLVQAFGKGALDDAAKEEAAA